MRMTNDWFPDFPFVLEMVMIVWLFRIKWRQVVKHEVFPKIYKGRNEKQNNKQDTFLIQIKFFIYTTGEN